jgi:hypothetical protein
MYKVAGRTAATAGRLHCLRVVVGDRPDIGARLTVPASFKDDPIRWPVEQDQDPTRELNDVDWLYLVGQSTGWLRRFALLTETGFRARRVTIVVETWRNPLRGWSGRVAALPGLVRHEVRLPTSRTGRAIVDLTLVDRLPVREIVLGGLAALSPGRHQPTTGSAGLGVGHQIPRPRLPAAAESVPAILVDAGVANPIGRNRIEPRVIARLRFDTSGADRLWRLDTTDHTVISGRLDRLPLSDDQLAAVRPIGVVECAHESAADPVRAAELLVQLASTGVILHAERLPTTVETYLSPALAKLVTSLLPEPPCDPTEWELRSVAQRRVALRDHASRFRLAPGAARQRATTHLPTVSVLLMTMRPDHLPRVIGAMAKQTYPELEIVVGLHGCELAPEVAHRLEACGRPVELVPVPRSLNLGEGLGVLTTHARGELVTKVDDDDIYGAEHVWDLVLAHEFSGAILAGKGAEFVHLETLGVTVRRSSMSSELYSTVVAGGTILLSRGDLASIGGWRPVPQGVDRALLDRVHQEGGLTYRTHPFGYVYQRHSAGHTWDPGLEYFLRQSGPQWSGLPPFAEFTDGGR